MNEKRNATKQRRCKYRMHALIVPTLHALPALLWLVSSLLPPLTLPALHDVGAYEHTRNITSTSQQINVQPISTKWQQHTIQTRHGQTTKRMQHRCTRTYLTWPTTPRSHAACWLVSREVKTYMFAQTDLKTNDKYNDQKHSCTELEPTPNHG